MDNSMELENKRIVSVLRLGAIVSTVQSILFFVIAATGLALGVGNFVQNRISYLAFEDPILFSVFSSTFILIAILGVAITPAEKVLVQDCDSGLAIFGSNLALLGHKGTIFFFSWWIFYVLSSQSSPDDLHLADLMMPIRWGIMFELFLVGLWVWIIAYLSFKHQLFSFRFRLLSIGKAISFWFTLGAFIFNSEAAILLGLGFTAALFGPVWHAWIAVILRNRCNELGGIHE